MTCLSPAALLCPIPPGLSKKYVPQVQKVTNQLCKVFIFLLIHIVMTTNSVNIKMQHGVVRLRVSFREGSKIENWYPTAFALNSKMYVILLN